MKFTRCLRLVSCVCLFCFCLCTSISAEGLPADSYDNVEVMTELPEITITRGGGQSGISLFASEAVGWRQLIIYSETAVASTSTQGASVSWSWGSETVRAYRNDTLVPDYTYQVVWTQTAGLSGSSRYDGVSGAVCSDLLTLSAGDVVAGQGFTVSFVFSGSLSGYQADNGNNYVFGLVDSSGELIKVISSERESGQNWRSSLDGRSVSYTFPAYSFEADADYTDVRLCLWAGASGSPDSSGNNYGAFGIKASSGSQFSVYFNASVVEGSGAGQDDTAGLLSGILEWLENIYQGVISIPTQIVSAIVNLGSTILDGIQNLFLPSGEDINAEFQSLMDWVDENFPLLSLPLTMVTWVVNLVNGVDPALASINFPEISWQGHVLIEETAFNFADIPGLETLLPYIQFLTTCSLLWAFGLWVRRKINSYWQDGEQA